MPKSKFKFKVGDRVRVVMDPMYPEMTGTITAIHEDRPWPYDVDGPEVAKYLAPHLTPAWHAEDELQPEPNLQDAR